MKQQGVKFFAFVLTIIMITGLIPPMRAQAEGADSAVPIQGDVTPSTYEDLNLNIKTPADFDADDGQHMYGSGTGYIALSTIDELGVFSQDGDDENRVYQAYNDLHGSSGFLSPSVYSEGLAGHSDTMERPIVVAADLTGTGQKNATVMFYGGDNDRRIHLRTMIVTPGEPGSAVQTANRAVYDRDIINADFLEYHLPGGGYDNLARIGHIEPWRSEGVYQMVAGDFDGEPGDEIAFYVPTLVANPRVEIWKWEDSVDDDGDSITHEFNLWKTLVLDYYQDTRQFPDGDRAIRALPSVTLTAGDITRDGRCDLIVAAAPPAYKTANIDGDFPWKYRASRLYILDETVWAQESTTLTPPANRIIVLGESLANQQVYTKMEDQQNRRTSSISFNLTGVGTAIGDVNGDRQPDLVVAGRWGNVNDGEWINFDQYFVNFLVYDQKTKLFSFGEDWFNTNKSPEIEMPLAVDTNTWNQMIDPVTVVCANIDGTSDYKGEVIFVEGLLIRWSQAASVAQAYPMFLEDKRGGFTNMENAAITEGDKKYGVKMLNTASDKLEWIQQAVVGNFDGNNLGKEQIAYIYGKRAHDNNYFFSLGLYGGDYNDYMDRGPYDHDAFLSICAPNIDQDSTIARFKSKSMRFTDPSPIAVLVSPPYFNDLSNTPGFGYQEGSSTEFGQSSGSGSSHSTGATVNASLTLKFEQSVGAFGIQAAQMEIGGSLDFGFTYTHSWSNDRSTGITFGTQGGTDSVALVAFPMTDYVYDAFLPAYKVTQAMIDENGGPILFDGTTYELGDTVPAHWEELTMSEPGAPFKSVIDVDTYDAVAGQTKGMEPIRGNIIHSVPGDPYTYSLAPHNVFDNMETASMRSSNTGSNSVSQSIDIESSESNEYDFTMGVSGNFSGGAAGISVGVAGYAGSGYAYGTVDYSGQSFVSTIANMPKEAEGYFFDWQFFVRQERLNANEIMVLDYALPNICSLPRAIQDLQVTDVGTESAQLRWTIPGETPVYPSGGYQIERKDEHFNEWQIIARVANGALSYWDEDMDPNTLYDYRVMAMGNLQKSAYSNTASCRTLNDGLTPPITVQPLDQNLLTGDTATFSVQAQMLEIGTQRLYYEWYREKESPVTGLVTTEKVPMGTSATLNIPELTLDNSNTRYFCEVKQLVDGNLSVSRSDTALLTVEKSKPTVVLSADIATGKAAGYGGGSPVTLSFVTTDGRTPMGQSTYEGQAYLSMKRAGSEGGVVSQQKVTLSDNGSATWTAPLAGPYEITLIYPGDSLNEAVVSNPVYYTALGSAEDRYLSIEGINDRVGVGTTGEVNTYLVSVSGGTVTRTEIGPPTSGATGLLSLTGNEYSAHSPGNVLLTASDSGLSTSRKVEVIPRAIVVKADAVSLNSGATLPTSFTAGCNDSTVVTENLGLMYSLTATNTESPGQYSITPSLKPDADVSAAIKAYRSAYQISFEPGILTVNQAKYKVEFSAGFNGSISATRTTTTGGRLSISNNQEVTKNTALSFTAVPNQHFAVESWKLNGDIVENPDGSNYTGLIYTVNSLSGAANVQVTFIPTQWTVNFEVVPGADLQTHGTIAATLETLNISPFTKVLGGKTLVFTATPAQGYMIGGWSVNGVAVKDHYDRTLRIDNLSEATTVQVLYMESTYIDVDYNIAGTGFGTLTAAYNSNPFASGGSVAYGGRVTFTATPSVSSIVRQWLVNGVPAAGNQPTFTYGPITSDVTVSVEFTGSRTCLVTYPTPDIEQGTLSAKKTSDDAPVASGATVDAYTSLTFTATPAQGYRVAAWKVNGSEQPGQFADTFILPSLQIDSLVEVVFVSSVGTHRVSFSQPEGGAVTATVDGNGIVNGALVSAGKNVVFTFTPDSGFKLIAWNVNGSAKAASTTYTVANLSGDLTVIAQAGPIGGPAPGPSGGGAPSESYIVTFVQPESGRLAGKAAGTDMISGDKISAGTALEFSYTADGKKVKCWMVNDTVIQYGGAHFSIPKLASNVKVALVTEDIQHIDYLTGYSDGTFRPDSPITRAEAALIFYRLDAGKEPTISAKNIFTDVDSSAWYYKAVLHLSDKGILVGDNNGLFRPDDNLTRAEFAKIVVMFASATLKNEPTQFSDLTSGHWAYKYIQTAFVLKWINGYPDQSFRPEQSISRAEAVSIINRIYDRNTRADGLSKELTGFTDLDDTHWAYPAILEASAKHTYTRTETGVEEWDTLFR